MSAAGTTGVVRAAAVVSTTGAALVPPRGPVTAPGDVEHDSPADSTGAFATGGRPGRVRSSAVVRRTAVPPDQAVPPNPEGAGGPLPDGADGPGVEADADGEPVIGARSEQRRLLREQKRLRIITLVVATVLILGALPLFFGVRAATRDPVFNTLDALGVPDWASNAEEDEISGSRWCIITCRLRERRAESSHPPAETAAVYERQLAASGWQRWKVDLCPDQPVPKGQRYTCWRRDEYTLDLWVREPSCVNDPLYNRPTVGPTTPGDGQAVPPAEKCDGSVVSIKVRNAIDDRRGHPQPTQDPDMTGEDPDPVFTDSPLLDETLPPS